MRGPTNAEMDVQQQGCMRVCARTGGGRGARLKRAGKEVRGFFFEVIRGARTFCAHLHDGREVVIHEDDVTRVLSDISARNAHRKTDICSLESGSVVGAITCHRHHLRVLADVVVVSVLGVFLSEQLTVFETAHKHQFVLFAYAAGVYRQVEA